MADYANPTGTGSPQPVPYPNGDGPVLCSEFHSFLDEMRSILSSNHSTLKTQVETQQTSIAHLEASMTAMQTSMNNVLAAQEADLKLVGVQILPLSDSLTPNPPLTWSEIAFEKG